jgi:hypothetical protein
MGDGISALSPLTQSYIDALIAEGDKFDRVTWLKRVREHERSAADRGNGAVVSDDANTDNARLQKSDSMESFSTAREQPLSKPVVRTMVRRFSSFHQPRPSPRKPTLTQRIVAVKAAWNAMKRKHRRNAIYVYLAAVFELIDECRQDKQIGKLIRCASALDGLPESEHAEPFAVLIRGTCDPRIDRKTVSRWSRALRYVAERKPTETTLKTFIKRKGGINACADRWARMRRRRADC